MSAVPAQAVSCDEPGSAAPAAEAPASRYGWYPLAELRGAFSGSADARNKARQRWARSLGAEQWRKQVRGGQTYLEVRGDALLPSGQRVADWLAGAFSRLPARLKALRRSSRERDLALRELAEKDRQFWREHPNLPPTSAGYLAEFRRVHGQWAAENKLAVSKSTLARLRRRVAAGELLDRRAVRSGRNAKSADPRLVERVKAVYLHRNRFSEVAVHEEQVRLAAELKIEPLTRWQVRRLIAGIPAAARALARERSRVFEANFVPKMAIDYTGLSAGSWVCLDGRVADVFVRVPGEGGGWKAVRPVVAGVMDMRSTKLLVEIGVTENHVLILRGLKRWVEKYGMPEEATRDQGLAYRKCGRRSWGRVAVDERVGDVFRRFGCTVHQTIPYFGWSKRLESIWRLLKKHCDRWHESFWGGSPAERSDEAEALLAQRVEELPTLDEFREHCLMAVETVNATPRRGLSGLSPNTAFDAFRGTLRRIDPDVLSVFFTVSEGPRKVSRDGIRHKNMLFTLEPEDLAKLQGREVWILPSLDSAGLVALVDQDERLLAYATQRQLVAAGSKDEHFRAAMAKKARLRRLAKAYLPQRDFLLESTTGQVLRAQREHAIAQERELRKQFAPPPAPAATLLRPDLAEQTKRLARRKAAGHTRIMAAGSNQPQTGLERLIQRGREEAAAERSQPREPTIGERFAALNRKYELEEAAG